MEFYVIDPKEFTYSQWMKKIRDFLDEAGLKYETTPGGLYYLGDDIAEPWSEESFLFKITDERAPGIIELRDGDNAVYAYADDLTIFDGPDIKEALGCTPRRARAVFGFEHMSLKGKEACRFQPGPSPGLCFLCAQDDEFPQHLTMQEVWNLVFKMIYWIGNNLNRVQDLNQVSTDKISIDFEVNLSFVHSSSMDALNEILAQEDGYERQKNSIRATFRERTIPFLREFTSLLPTDQDEFEKLLCRAVWRCEDQDNKRHDLFFVGAERRHLAPFIQLPVQATSRQLIEDLRAYLKGHRIDKRDHSLI